MPDVLRDITLPGYAITIIKVAAVLLAASALNRLIRRAIRRYASHAVADDIDLSSAREEKRVQTLVGVLRAAASVLVWALGALLAVGQTGIDIGPLVAAAGIGGVALGFGAQTLVRDVIAGFFILLEDQYHVGDVVEVAGVSGAVEKITLHSTVLRNVDGRQHVVPNGAIDVATNHTNRFSRYLLDLPVPYDVDSDRAVDVATSVLDQMRSDEAYSSSISGPLVVLGVQDYAASEVLVRVYIETVPGKQWEVGREFRRRVKKAYDAAGISIPFPHREVIVRPAGQAS